jgi:adenylosuccinate synthase
MSEGELTWEELSKRSGIDLAELKGRERTSTTNRRRRVGEFDWVWLHRASALNRPTDVALTFADYINVKNRQAHRFDQLSAETIKFVEQIEAVAEAPVSLISTKFSRRTIIDRRRW